MVAKITACKGITPSNASRLIRATFNAVLAYGLEVVPIWGENVGQRFLDKLEIIQRRSIRAIIDAPFCAVNEVVEIGLGFCKMRHVLWMRTLNL